MSDEIEWKESDNEYEIAESDSVPLSDVINGVKCKDCNRNLTIALNPDPDSLMYWGECEECDLRYRFTVTHVKATVSDSTI